MMQGVGIAAAIKGDSYQQTVQSFFTAQNNPSKNYSSNQGWNAGLSKACFSCGREGHFMHTCPQKTAGSSLSNPASMAVTPNLPKVPCPRCQKGYHWAKDCRSKFHKNRTLLVPDQQSGSGLRGQPQAPTMIGATTKPIQTLCPITELIRATPGSTGLDLSSTTSTILTPDSPTLKIPTGVKGPLLTGLVGIILGRSSSAKQGLVIIPGVIDSDYTGEIQIMISPPTKTTQIHQGQRIAQLLLLPYHTAIGHTATQSERQEKGFGSSDMVFWVKEITQKRPMKTILVSGTSVAGL